MIYIHVLFSFISALQNFMIVMRQTELLFFEDEKFPDINVMFVKEGMKMMATFNLSIHTQAFNN